MAALWYEESCRSLWRFYSGDSHSPDDETFGKVESSERWHGDGRKPCVEELMKSATSHIIYCLVQYMECWIHGFPTGSSVKTSCIVIKQFSGDSRCFIETSCQQEGWLVFRQSHSLNCYMFCGLTATGRSVLCPSTFDHQRPDSWISASVLSRPPVQYAALALARLKEVYISSVHVQR